MLNYISQQSVKSGVWKKLASRESHISAIPLRHHFKSTAVWTGTHEGTIYEVGLLFLHFSVLSRHFVATSVTRENDTSDDSFISGLCFVL